MHVGLNLIYLVPDNTGGLLNDMAGHAWPNYAGCLALFDQDAACAAPFQQLQQCQYYSCGTPACYAELHDDGGQYVACTNSTFLSDGGACVGYYYATAPCGPDFVQDSGAWYARCDTIKGTLSEICGP